MSEKLITSIMPQTTVLTVPSLHCESCVEAIRQALEERAFMIEVDVERRLVTVRHDASQLTVAKLAALLQEVGYPVEGASVIDDDRTLTPATSVMLSPADAKGVEHLESQQQRHREHCKLCRETIKDGSTMIIEMPQPRTRRVDLSIEGMTCSSCVGGITKALRSEAWIISVDVALLTNSASVVIDASHSPEEVVELIEDLGYGARIIETQEFAGSSGPGEEARRTVTIELKGFHCPRCPLRVAQALQSLSEGIDADLSSFKLPTEDDPSVDVSYLPRPPDFTIRTILSTISSLDRAFNATLRVPASPEDRANKIRAREQRGLLVRAIGTIIIAIPTFIIGVVFMSLTPKDSPANRYLSHPLSGVMRSDWILLALSTPVYFFAADVFHRRALKAIWVLWRPGSRATLAQRFLRFGSMDVLISLGVTVAYVASLGQVIAASTTRRAHDKSGNSDSYFDSVVFLTMFLLLGRLLEAMSKAKTGETVAKLGTLRPTTATLCEGGEVPASLLEVGDIVRVAHGASPPWDGVLEDEEAHFSEATLTGEAMSVAKARGAPVYSGTVNVGSPVAVRITAAAGKSLLDKVIDLVRQGQTRRAPVEDLADELTAHFVPAIVLVALVTWLVWLGLGLGGRLPASWLDVESGGWPFWSLQFAIAVFVVACPCGIGLAAPTAIFVGGGLAAEHGILAKGGGEAFERASRVDAVVFDKTGTLTRGEVSVAGYVRVDDGWEEAMIKACVAGLESRSSHPVARAACDWARQGAMDDATVRDVVEVAGKGIQGIADMPDGKVVGVMVGNEAMLAEHGVEVPSATAGTLRAWKQEGKSVILVAGRPAKSDNWSLVAILAASDTVRDEARDVVSHLERRGIACWMLSGDNRAAALSVAAAVGIDPSRVVAELLPEQKVDQVKRLRSSQHTVAMVGDGINDSPALSLADVGIAIGTGSDVAISAASFVLLNADLRTLLVVLDLSKAVLRRVKVNFAWAILYNAAALPVAAGVLYPVVAGGKHVRLDPVWASLAMALSSVSVVCSSLLLRTRLPVMGWRGGGAPKRANGAWS